MRQKYPNRIPVICEKVEKSDIPSIDKKKYLVPAELTVGQFVFVVRKRIKLSPEKAIFIFVNDVLPVGLVFRCYNLVDQSIFLAYSHSHVTDIRGAQR